ncbi:hypothetical protein [Streptomyces griseocarneus]|uniref:hypothetical protein n=1 Tax=Streptomyces griseocarneus TaxID=51201 RepID=UPI00167D26AC|nr:hypothetical protein [Streptomyces griseocarneus]MBZ6475251.1 hypothetical protein [Streptomyces griseocarneus]GHG61418.1 hypothetical protein GCM10018779_29270 [Streptomyces griseocarneus]
MSTGRQWTIDGISHALPHPELRATFMREVSFTDVDALPRLLHHWVTFVQQFESERPRIERLRGLVDEDGRLPATPTAGPVEVTADELRAAAGRGGRGAA